MPYARLGEHEYGVRPAIVEAVALHEGELEVGVRAGERRLHADDRAVLDLLAVPIAVAMRADELSAAVQASRRAIVEGREEERRRLRRDLHDGLGPVLTGIAFQADAVVNLADTDPAEVRALGGEIRGAVGDALADVRRLIYQLRPAALDEWGLVEAVRRHAQRLAPLDTRITAGEVRRPVRRRRGGGLPDRHRGAHQRGPALDGGLRRGRHRSFARGAVADRPRRRRRIARAVGARRRAAVAAGAGRRAGRRPGGGADAVRWRGQGVAAGDAHDDPGRARRRPPGGAPWARRDAPLGGRDIDVIGEAADGHEAVRAAVTLSPDVIVLDIHMPGLDGVAAAREIRRAAPDVGILMLTMLDDDASVRAAVSAGAAGYVLKGDPQDRIVRAIHAVACGDAFLAAGVARLVMDAPPDPFAALTPRERQLLELLAAGVPTTAMARRLGVAPKTVSNTLSTVYAKLGVTNRTEAALRARDAGLGG